MANYTQQERNGLYELTDSARAELSSSKYYNVDLAPTTIDQRTWTTYSITNLWIGMSICIPSLSLAAALIQLGVSPWLSVLNVALGNLLVLIPIQMNSHAGTKYGIPFPAFARLTFGSMGAQIPAIARALVACGWTSVQAWVGGGAVAALIGSFAPKFLDAKWSVAMPGSPETPIGTLIGFFIFMAFIGWVAYNGMENIKWVQNIGGPLLVVVMLLLFIWSIKTASDSGHSFGQVLSASSNKEVLNQRGGFTYIYMAGLTGNIAFWATMALNIPDFSRYARSQKDQFRGQLFGMPLPMFLCAFIGAFFAKATELANGQASFNPTDVFYYVNNRFIIFIAAIGVIAATVTTCVAANVVAPANGFSNISPKKISYKKGVVATCILACLANPWYIYGAGAAFIFAWMNNYGIILAPIAALFIADYYICKQRRIDVADLYRGPQGRYWYTNGWNFKAIIAWIAAFIIPLIGNTVYLYDADKRPTPNFFDYLAANGYLVSFAIGILVYVLLMKNDKRSTVSEEEHTSITEVVK